MRYLLWMLLLLPACAQWNVANQSQSKVSASIKGFSHQTHERALAAASIQCDNCHLLGVSLRNKSSDVAKGLSHSLLYPGKEQCHYCHNNNAYTGSAPRQCSLCHLNEVSIMPANHRGNWVANHKIISRTEKESCIGCHRDDFCTDCHFKRDTIRQKVHDRNFIFIHSIRARGNPRKCTTCHTAYFCKECHTERGVTQ